MSSNEVPKDHNDLPKVQKTEVQKRKLQKPKVQRKVRLEVRIEVRLRDFHQRDFSRICEIDRLCYSEAIAYTPEEMALGLVQPDAFVLVAEAGEQVIAFVLAYRKKRSLGNSVGHIVTIDVVEEFRARGIGHRLMESAEQRLRQNGARRIILEVETENGPALRFYKRRGYAIQRLLSSYYADGSDAYLMEKALA